MKMWNNFTAVYRIWYERLLLLKYSYYDHNYWAACRKIMSRRKTHNSINVLGYNITYLCDFII